MPFISSPVAYPPSSSPAVSPTKKRKRTHDVVREPLKLRDNNTGPEKVVNLFEEESSDEEDQAEHDSGIDISAAKRTKTTSAVGHDLQQGVSTRVHFGASIFSRATGPKTDSSVSLQQHVSNSGRDFTGLVARSTEGYAMAITTRAKREKTSYQQIVAERSETVGGRAQRSYYGINVNQLLEQAKADELIAAQSRAAPIAQSLSESSQSGAKKTSTEDRMWTEKYRARKFTDLVGDDRTHRTVMHWLKAWDPVVFPGAARKSQMAKSKSYRQDDNEHKAHRKVLLLTGPPGLGKTTLAHVCARQAGYEVAEINGSDDRSRDTVKGKIRDILGTENVKSASMGANTSEARKLAKPVCLIVDEVDGVTGSSGGGEGGFVKAFIDLLLLDQRNSASAALHGNTTASSKKGKKDAFRMLRPLIMICNDAYNNALRPLRTSGLIEILHVNKPTINTVTSRVQSIFQIEGIACDGDAVRKLCEGCWGITSKKEGGSGSGAGEGDMRSILVLAEWLSRRLRSEQKSSEGVPRLTKKWLEAHLAKADGGQVYRGLGRGGSKEIVERVFMDNAGLSRTTSNASTFKTSVAATSGNKGVKSVNEALKAASSSHVRGLVDGHGESDRIITDLFTQYPIQPFQDDTFLTKPVRAYEWLNFHDQVSSAVFSSAEWELAPYLSTPVVGFHHLFATSSAIQARHASANSESYYKYTNDNHEETATEHPFQTWQSAFAASQRQKEHTSVLQTLHESLSLPLTRLFPRPEMLSTEFVPYLLRCLSPAVNPVLITSSTSAASAASGPSKGARYENNKTTASVRKASEKVLIDRAVNAMLATGTRFERHRIETTTPFGGAGGTAVGTGPKKAFGGAAAAAAAAGFVFRMQPAVDEYGVYETLCRGRINDVGGGVSAPGGRYAVRQVLVQECAAEGRRRDGEARARRRRGAGGEGAGESRVAGGEEEAEGKKKGGEGEEGGKRRGVKRDFFGRVVAVDESAVRPEGGQEKSDGVKGEGRVWVTFHEGYSNAVRKPVTLAELMRGL